MYIAILICVIMALHQIGSLHIGMVSIVTDIMGSCNFIYLQLGLADSEHGLILLFLHLAGCNNNLKYM